MYVTSRETNGQAANTPTVRWITCLGIGGYVEGANKQTVQSCGWGKEDQQIADADSVVIQERAVPRFNLRMYNSLETNRHDAKDMLTSTAAQR